MDQWLVRTSKNLIAGPYTKDQICQLIRDGQLTHQDEVCRANDYWITLHEREEVLRLLGIEMPKAAGEEEVTETQTETAATLAAAPERTDPELQALDAAAANVGESTAVLNRNVLRGMETKRAAENASPAVT